jgi:hypothetical protein
LARENKEQNNIFFTGPKSREFEKKRSYDIFDKFLQDSCRSGMLGGANV